MKSIFHGVIAESLIFPFPSPSQTETDNLNMMLDSVRKFAAAQVDSVKIDKEMQIPTEVLQGLRDLGLFGLNIPEAYGGLGLTATGYARIMQEVSGLDSSLGVTIGAHQSIGLKALLIFGTDEQKKKYLPRLATGEIIAAFALTEPSAGSDAAAIQTHAEFDEKTNTYTLNGSKIWISNGAFAEFFTVFARTSAAESGAKPRITAFIVERGEGVRHGPNEHKLGIRGSATNTIYFDNVKVPAANVLGEVGRGFKVAMEVLNSGRLGLATGCIGMAKKLLHLAVERTQDRKAFGRSIGEFGLIKDKIASMMAETYALECMAYLTTGLIDAKVGDYSVESAICKVFASESLWRTVNETLQIAAGIGYMQEYPYERYLRDARINLIFEGTNEILRCFIALSGMQGPGKELIEVAKAMREPIKGFGLLSDFAVRKARSALGRERMFRAHALLNRETVVLEEYTQALASNIDKVLRKHGKNIAEMQYTQKRVADIAIDLYAIAALLSRTSQAIQKNGEEGAKREVDLTAIFVNAAEKRLRTNIAEFETNDDELRKSVASKTYADGGYPFDVV